jgi:hypothetical protein
MAKLMFLMNLDIPHYDTVKVLVLEKLENLPQELKFGAIMLSLGLNLKSSLNNLLFYSRVY